MKNIKQFFKWELAWSKAKGRWYYQDRISGEATWEAPQDSKFDPKEVESRPPPTEWPADAPRAGIADGWTAHWDATKKKYYYINEDTGKRTWFLPVKPEYQQTFGEDEDAFEAVIPDVIKEDLGSAGSDFKSVLGYVKEKELARGSVAPVHEHATPAEIREHARAERAIEEAKKHVAKQNHDLLLLLWEPGAFLERVRESASRADLLAQCWADLKASNERYLRVTETRVPKTARVTFADCQEAVNSGEIDVYDTEPMISMSHNTMAEAAAFFSLDSKRVVVCLNFSSGQGDFIGSGYPDGICEENEKDAEKEADLCRRIPNFYPSLLNARKDGLYPFGPYTCTDESEPNQYSSVLYTPSVEVDYITAAEFPGLSINRTGFAKGFAIYTKHVRDRKVGIVSAAAPKKARLSANPREHTPEIFDCKHVANTISVMMMAPVMQEPRVTTLVLGLWGVGASATAEMMGAMFGQAIASGREVVATASEDDKSGHVKLGHLYHEIHFALPMENDADEKLVHSFQVGLSRAGVEITPLPQLGVPRLTGMQFKRRQTAEEEVAEEAEEEANIDLKALMHGTLGNIVKVGVAETLKLPGAKVAGAVGKLAPVAGGVKVLGKGLKATSAGGAGLASKLGGNAAARVRTGGALALNGAKVTAGVMTS